MTSKKWLLENKISSDIEIAYADQMQCSSQIRCFWYINYNKEEYIFRLTVDRDTETIQNRLVTKKIEGYVVDPNDWEDSDFKPVTLTDDKLNHLFDVISADFKKAFGLFYDNSPVLYLRIPKFNST